MKWQEYIKTKYVYRHKLGIDAYNELIKIVDKLLKQCRDRTIKRMIKHPELLNKQKKLL